MTFASALLAVTLTASTTPAELEAAATRQVALEYERIGRRTPIRDDALSGAARSMAKKALDQNARAATDLVALTEAVSFAEAWDPSPRALVIKGSPADEPMRLLLKRKDLAQDVATHVGIGAVVRGDASAVVVLFTARRVKLEPFSRQVPKPQSSRELCGTLEAHLSSPEVVITQPDGKVSRVTLSKQKAQAFCAPVPFPVEGRYTVEVLARGARGPEVAALFFADVGGAPSRDEDPLAEEPTDPDSARTMLVERINALRRAHGVKPLQLDDAVTRVAQAYSEQMAEQRFFAHVAPDGSSVGARLRRAGYAHRAAGENLGTASGPLAAHFGIEHSPGHRKNLLDPQWTRVGIGIATQQTDGEPQVLLTEIFADPVTPTADPVGNAYETLASKRSELMLPKLQRNSVLEQLALDHARKALELDEPKSELPGSKLHERVFDALDDAKAASIDLFVADDPSLIDASSATRNPGYAWVGIGAVKGDSPRFGKGKYWVVVIYASPR